MVSIKSTVLYLLACVFFSWGAVAAADFKVAVQQSFKDADVTTHEIRSGEVVLGVSEFGGGYINKLYIPGVGDILTRDSARYGRGGQVSIRDRLHHGKYNPTQAGFTDSAGTHCVVKKYSSGLLLLPARPCSLWHGDRKYDFTEWENLAADPYKQDGGVGDLDHIDEKNLNGRQAAEITSEFDFKASYENAKDDVRVQIPAFRFLYEFRFIREPGHCLRQFNQQTSIYRPSEKILDISNLAPVGTHPSTETSLTGVILSSMLRGSKSVWDPSVIYSVNRGGKLVARIGEKVLRNVYYEKQKMKNEPLVIFAKSTDPDRGPAIGFFQPRNHINIYGIVGRSLKGNFTSYEDDRFVKGQMMANRARTSGMWLIGARTEFLGILDTTLTPDGVYETLRGESYILIGSPNEILGAANSISKPH